MANSAPGRFVLTFSCPDVPGLQAAVTTYLFEIGAFLEEVASYGDPDTRRFFSRIVFVPAAGKALELGAVHDGFGQVAQRFNMDWQIVDAARKLRTLIAVSSFGHCLNDLLHRWSSGNLPIDIVGVISNHDKMRRLVEWHGLTFHHLPVTKETKMEQEAEFMGLVRGTGAELVVLARYMQVLSEGMCAKLTGRCINIHHSFLPSFKGARPYGQAHERGVKIIGATAHYVTPDLDEGPIIEQSVDRVDHTCTVEDLVNIGRDIESAVLARAVKWHAERRILLNAKRTIVFR